MTTAKRWPVLRPLVLYRKRDQATPGLKQGVVARVGLPVKFGLCEDFG